MDCSATYASLHQAYILKKIDCNGNTPRLAATASDRLFRRTPLRRAAPRGDADAVPGLSDDIDPRQNAIDAV